MKGFTEPAVTLATHIHPQTILLWNKDDIDYVVNNGNICASFETKYKQYIAHCTPEFERLCTMS